MFAIFISEEFMFQHPFYDKNPLKLQANIIAAKPKWNTHSDPVLKQFLNSLFIYDPDVRSNWAQIQKFPFFKYINWVKVQN